jgi:hypothetical protein
MSLTTQTMPMPPKAKLKSPLTEKQAELDRAKINERATPHVPAIVKRLLPKGYVKGRHWQAHFFDKGQVPMQLQVDLVNGAWCDFHSNRRGTDIQGLIGYIAKLDVLSAQLALRQMLGEGQS